MRTGDVSRQCAFFSTCVHHLLVLYQAGRSSSVSSVRFGGVYLHLRVSCVSLLPPAACSNSSSSGGADVYPLDSHLRPGVAPAGAAEDRQRNVRPVCGGGERHLPQQKRYVPFPPFWVAGLIGSVCLDPGRFLLRQLANWTSQYETSFPVPAEPKGETHSTKGITWVTRHFVTFKPPCLVQFEWWLKHYFILFLHYTAPFRQPLKASKVNVL